MGGMGKNVMSVFKDVRFSILFFWLSFLFNIFISYLAVNSPPLSGIPVFIWLSSNILAGLAGLFFIYRVAHEAKKQNIELPSSPLTLTLLAAIPVINIIGVFYSFGVIYKLTIGGMNWRKKNAWLIYIFVILNFIYFYISKKLVIVNYQINLLRADGLPASGTSQLDFFLRLEAWFSFLLATIAIYISYQMQKGIIDNFNHIHNKTVTGEVRTETVRDKIYYAKVALFTLLLLFLVGPHFWSGYLVSESFTFYKSIWHLKQSLFSLMSLGVYTYKFAIIENSTESIGMMYVLYGRDFLPDFIIIYWYTIISAYTSLFSILILISFVMMLCGIRSVILHFILLSTLFVQLSKVTINVFENISSRIYEDYYPQYYTPGDREFIHSLNDFVIISLAIFILLYIILRTFNQRSACSKG